MDLFVKVEWSTAKAVSKSKLELESNLSKILSVNCKFIRNSTLTQSDKLKLEYLKLGFKCKTER